MIGKTSAGTSAKEEKTVTAGTAQKVVTPSNGKLLSKVTINPTPSQAKTATPTVAQQTIKPDSGKLLSQVLVNAVPDSEKKGLYVWKKYQYTPAETVTNPSFTYNITKYSETVTISNENFDLTKVGENWIEFFNGFGNSSGNLEVKNGKLYYGNRIFSAFDPVAKTFTVSDTWNSSSSSAFSYEGTKTFSSEQRVFLDYVVSDAETAYPDNGLQNGYWYEKVVEEIKGCSITFITPSSWNKETTVQHTLGKIPSAVAVCRVKGSSDDFSHQNVLCAANTCTQGYNGTNFYGAVYSYSTASNAFENWFTCTDSEITMNGGSAYLEVGVTYAFIALG